MTTTPAVIEYPPPRSEPATRGRRGNAVPGRWATIERIIVPDTGRRYFRRDEVINISMMIPANRPPELPGLEGVEAELSHRYYLERVPLGVKIGMVRDGPIDPVGGFGYPDGSEPSGWIWFADNENSGLLAVLEF